MKRSSPRPWQFSLKWFLVATTFLALLAGVIGRIVHELELRRQRAEQARLAQEKALIALLDSRRLMHTHETEDGLERSSTFVP